MILTDVTKLKTSEIFRELSQWLLEGPESSLDWERVEELIKEGERRAFEAERLADS